MKGDLDVQLNSILATDIRFFPRQFTNAELDLFTQYFHYVLKWNDRLHLTTLTTPHDFAHRHLLESAFATQFISPSIPKIFDIGSGAGIPGIPFAILRPNISITLIEANKKKAIFLKEIKFALGLGNVEVINQRFEDIRVMTNRTCITSRALDKLSSLIPNILHFGQDASQFLLFGTNIIQDMLKKQTANTWNITKFPVPESDQRLLLSLSRST